MATYLQGVSNVIAPQKLFTPNYEFLARSLGQKQSEYDRGLSHIKNVYDSLLNSDLTNEDNMAYRDQAFKKLKTAMRSTSSLDLSKTSNISKALDLVKPISEDKDLVYDMFITKKNREQAQLGSQYRTSTDMDKRAMYNNESMLDIQFSRDDLKNSKRGDGSIQQIRPGEFVPFEDVNQFLNERAKELNLEVVFDHTQGGYIVTDKNGKQAIPIFQQWAAQQMGNRFDRQFQLKGKIDAESKIRGKMETEGISRSESVQSFVGETTPETQARLGKDTAALQKNLDFINRELDVFEQGYGSTGFPTSKPGLKKRHDELILQKQYHEDALKQTSGSLKAIDEDNEFIANNMYGIGANKYKQNAASSWGSVTAMATSSRELKSDATWIAKQNMALKAAFHRDDMIIKKAEYALKVSDNSLKEKEFELKKQNFILKEAEYLAKLNGGKFDAKNDGSSSSSSSSSGDAASETYLGKYTSDETDFAIDKLQQAFVNNTENVYKGVTNRDNGIMKLIVTDDDYNETLHAINLIKDVSQGKKASFTDADKKAIESYYTKIGFASIINDDMYTDEKAAGLAMEAFGKGSYEIGAMALKSYAESGTLPDRVKNIESFKQVMASMEDTEEKRNILTENYKQIHQEVYDLENGEIRDIYEGAVKLGVNTDGTPLWDLSKVSDEGKKQIGILVDDSFKDLRVPVGSEYEFNGINAAELDVVLSSTKAIVRDSSGDILDEDDRSDELDGIDGLNTGDLQKLLNDGMKVSYDPVKETALITIKTSPKETAISKAKGIKNGAVYTVELPYEVIRANAAALPRFNKYMRANTSGSAFVGKLRPFQQNKNAMIKSDSTDDNINFNYSMTGAFNSEGQYGINIFVKYLDPVEGTYETYDSFIPINNKRNAYEFNNIYKDLLKQENDYIDALGEHRKFLIEKGDYVPFYN